MSKVIYKKAVVIAKMEVPDDISAIEEDNLLGELEQNLAMDIKCGVMYPPDDRTLHYDYTVAIGDTDKRNKLDKQLVKDFESGKVVFVE